MSGGEVEAVHRVAAVLRRRAEEIEEAVTAVALALDRVVWVSPDASDLRARGRRRASRAEVVAADLRSVAAMLEASAAEGAPAEGGR